MKKTILRYMRRAKERERLFQKFGILVIYDTNVSLIENANSFFHFSPQFSPIETQIPIFILFITLSLSPSLKKTGKWHFTTRTPPLDSFSTCFLFIHATLFNPVPLKSSQLKRSHWLAR